MTDELVVEYYGDELEKLRNDFELWAPTTSRMKSLRRKVGASLFLQYLSLLFCDDSGR
jgi:hypothetical protein